MERVLFERRECRGEVAGELTVPFDRPTGRPEECARPQEPALHSRISAISSRTERGSQPPASNSACASLMSRTKSSRRLSTTRWCRTSMRFSCSGRLKRSAASSASANGVSVGIVDSFPSGRVVAGTWDSTSPYLSARTGRWSRCQLRRASRPQVCGPAAHVDALERRRLSAEYTKQFGVETPAVTVGRPTLRTAEVEEEEPMDSTLQKPALGAARRAPEGAAACGGFRLARGTERECVGEDHR